MRCSIKIDIIHTILKTLSPLLFFPKYSLFTIGLPTTNVYNGTKGTSVGDLLPFYNTTVGLSINPFNATYVYEHDDRLDRAWYVVKSDASCVKTDDNAKFNCACLNQTSLWNESEWSYY